MLGELIPNGGGDPIPLLQPRLVIGRRSDCDIVLMFANVSLQHCELELRSGYWQVRDLNSREGIKVNGERVSHRLLYSGDILSIGKNHYEIQYEPPDDDPPWEDGEPVPRSNPP